MSNGTFSSNNEIHVKCVNTIRALAMDAIQKANSGHPGAPMGLASAAYVLWTGIMNHNPKNPDWLNRDRFVLSGGHASMLLYSLLHLTGYDLALDDMNTDEAGVGKLGIGIVSHAQLPETVKAPGEEYVLSTDGKIDVVIAGVDRPRELDVRGG